MGKGVSSFSKLFGDMLGIAAASYAVVARPPEDETVERVLRSIGLLRERYASDKQPTDLVLSPAVWAALRHDEGVTGGPVNYPTAFAGLLVYIAYDRLELESIMEDLRRKGRRPMRVLSQAEATVWFPKKEKAE